MKKDFFSKSRLTVYYREADEHLDTLKRLKSIALLPNRVVAMASACFDDWYSIYGCFVNRNLKPLDYTPDQLILIWKEFIDYIDKCDPYKVQNEFYTLAILFDEFLCLNKVAIENHLLEDLLTE